MVNNTNNLKAILKLLQEKTLDAYIVPSNDEYNSEYTSKHFNRLAYISNFTGSFGFAILLQDKGILCTDGRYILQANKELDLNYFTIININDFKLENLLKLGFNLQNSKIGYDPALFNARSLSRINFASLIAVDENLVDKIWQDRPQLNNKKFFAYDIKYSGQNANIKLQNILQKLNLNDDQYLLSTDSAFNCWLFNIRGFDLDNTPIVLSYALISHKEIILYTENLIEDDTKLELQIIIKSIKDFYFDLEKVKTQEFLLDKNLTNIKILNLLTNIKHFNMLDLQMLQAIKNNTEIQLAKDGHIKDAVALIESFAEIESKILLNENITEKEIENILISFRKQQVGYFSESFNAICGYEENGAIIHYRAPKIGSKAIHKNILLIDSGAQYLGATTDVTRNLILSEPTLEQKEMYTRVLMGHIDLCLMKVPVGTLAFQLDTIARKYLWEINCDYAHGTGHGVGSFLGVHEGPISISKYNNTELKPGMIFSNEPGFYKENEFGIRIENLVFVKQSDSNFLAFENLTLVPYCKKLINYDMLNDSHKIYLSNYHNEIKIKVLDSLSLKAKEWLLNNI
ncbi:MAG: aminopeptidase P family protein [Rickettsiales bacterium]